MTDINLAATITGYSNTGHAMNNPEYANDNSGATAASRDAFVASGITVVDYLQSDLGSTYVVTYVGATRNNDSDVPMTYLSYSRNGTSWTNVAADTSSPAFQEWNLTGVTARYLRLVYTQAYGLSYCPAYSMRTWEVRGTPPGPGIYADWAADGFDGPGTDDDILADVASFSITRGASAEITGGATPGSATIMLNNPADDRYNPLNTGGPLYGDVTDGVPVWIGPNVDGGFTGSSPRGLFAGRITDITPIPQAGGIGRAAFVELKCEDALGWYARTPARVVDALYRSQGAFRAALLTAAGETRTSLAHEIETMPISAWDGNLGPALEELNKANGTRHLAKPSDSWDDWYAYTTYNRQHRLDGTVDATLDAGADHVTGTGGWRMSADTVINQQTAKVTPIAFSPSKVIWMAPNLPMRIKAKHATITRIVQVTFDEYVADAYVEVAYSGTSPTVIFQSYGSIGRIAITTTGDTRITTLNVRGRLVARGQDESAVADDLTSQAAPRGVRAGSEITGDLVGTLASAQGIADHVVWRYGNPQFRPTLTVVNWLPEMLELDLFDVISVTIAQLGMTARLFEIVGLTIDCDFAASASEHYYTATYVLQECRVQSDPGWFTLGSSLLDSTDKLAY